MTKATKYIQLSERALLARINRKLAADDEIVKKARPDSMAFSNLGEYYRLDFSKNAVIDHHIDLAELAKELEVLKPYEKLEEGE